MGVSPMSSTAVPAVSTTGILPVKQLLVGRQPSEHTVGRMPTILTGKMPVLRYPRHRVRVVVSNPQDLGMAHLSNKQDYRKTFLLPERAGFP